MISVIVLSLLGVSAAALLAITVSQSSKQPSSCSNQQHSHNDEHNLHLTALDLVYDLIECINHEETTTYRSDPSTLIAITKNEITIECSLLHDGRAQITSSTHSITLLPSYEAAMHELKRALVAKSKAIELNSASATLTAELNAINKKAQPNDELSHCRC